MQFSESCLWRVVVIVHVFERYSWHISLAYMKNMHIVCVITTSYLSDKFSASVNCLSHFVTCINSYDSLVY